MADNDLALGRIVEFLSHTRYWKQMAIFVTQDDAGGEPDHVDAQRSVLLVISPWARRCYVSHRQTTIVSMHRTLYQNPGPAPAQPVPCPGQRLLGLLYRDARLPALPLPGCGPSDFRLRESQRPEGPGVSFSAAVEPSIKRDDPDDEEEILSAAAAGTAVSRPKQ